MAIIKQLNKKTGITYVYESRSFRDKETKQPRSERKLIGRIDDKTGEIIPTRKKTKKLTTQGPAAAIETTVDASGSSVMDIIREKDATVTELRREIDRLQKEKAELASELERITAKLRE